MQKAICHAGRAEPGASSADWVVCRTLCEPMSPNPPKRTNSTKCTASASHPKRTSQEGVSNRRYAGIRRSPDCSKGNTGRSPPAARCPTRSTWRHTLPWQPSTKLRAHATENLDEHMPCHSGIGWTAADRRPAAAVRQGDVIPTIKMKGTTGDDIPTIKRAYAHKCWAAGGKLYMAQSRNKLRMSCR